MKIDLKKVRDSYFDNTSVLVSMYYAKIFQMLLSKKLKPEQYNGVVNLLYTIDYPNATAEHIESSLVICAYASIERKMHLTGDK